VVFLTALHIGILYSEKTKKQKHLTHVIVIREELVQHWQQVIEQKGSQHIGQVISTKKAEPINYS
jgi:hypothetical protein